jgi:hypothetical protein
MRTIQISTSVFAAIWAARQEGEESEDAILNRLLGREAEPDTVPPHGSPNVGGHTERSYGVHFAGGFEIFRTYLGQSYRAHAVQLGWILDKGNKTYPTLNELSKAIGAKVENAWAHWFYMTPEGQRKPVATLRDPGKVARRTRGPVDADKLLSQIGIPGSQAETGA